MTQAKARAGGIIRESLDSTWRTPERILDRVRVYFGGPIPLDPATASSNPTKALAFHAEPTQPDLFDPERGIPPCDPGGLAIPWDAPVFCNPPYGRELRAWLCKMVEEARRCTTIIALIPCARFEQAYLQDALAEANALCLPRGRVDFISSIDGAAVKGNPYASMLLGFNVIERRWVEAFAALGQCYALRAMRGDA